MRRGVSPVVSCLAAAALFGASTPAAKVLLSGAGPLTLAGLLYLGAALAVLPWAFRPGARRVRRAPVQWKRLAGSVVVGGGLGPVLLLTGLRLAPAGSVSLWLNLESVATAVLAWLLFREHMGGRTWSAVALVSAAGVLLTAPSSFGLVPAAALVAAACLAWGLDNNLTALIDGFTPAQITFAKGAVAGSVNLGLGILFGGPAFHWGFVAPALAVGALGYGLSIVLYIAGARELGAARSQMFFASAPFMGAVLSWAALGERPATLDLGAAALMVFGMALMLSQHHEHPHEHEALRHTHAHRHDDGHHTHVHPGLPAGVVHTHEHVHEPVAHAHPHLPDLHHRHEH